MEETDSGLTEFSDLCQNEAVLQYGKELCWKIMC